jgi:hypothetical protein
VAFAAKRWRCATRAIDAGQVIAFTTAERQAFVAGTEDGEFDVWLVSVVLSGEAVNQIIELSETRRQRSGKLKRLTADSSAPIAAGGCGEGAADRGRCPDRPPTFDYRDGGASPSRRVDSVDRQRSSHYPLIVPLRTTAAHSLGRDLPMGH